MGRPSKLSPAQWAEIQHRLLHGETAQALAKEYKIARSTIQERFSDTNRKIKDVANQLVAAETSLRVLSFPAQITAMSLAEELRAVSQHLAGAAKYGAATAHRIAGIANGIVARISDSDPLDEASIEALKGISALTRVSNDAAATGLNLLAANKEQMRRLEDAEREGQSPDADARHEALAAKLEREHEEEKGGHPQT